MTQFVRLTENNGWEGESWNFYLQLDGNEGALSRLLVLLDADAVDDEYELDLQPIEEWEVDTLVAHSDSGYLQYENKVLGRFTCPEEWTDELEQKLYKGGIYRFFEVA